MKTFAEQNGHLKIDWFEFLNKPMRDVGFFEMEKMNKASGTWVTCAVGNQCAVIPRRLEHGRPKDDQLFFLGCEFGGILSKMSSAWLKQDESTYMHYSGNAVRCLKEIEERSSQLIQEINDNSK